jgi:hypothetical protein
MRRLILLTLSALALSFGSEAVAQDNLLSRITSLDVNAGSHSGHRC